MDLSSFSPTDIDTVIRNNPDVLLRLVEQDHGLDQHKKSHIKAILNSPEVFDHLMAGAAGAIIVNASTHYIQMSKPARVLLSLAGFGLGNIIYNTIHERKFTTFDPGTGRVKIKL